MRRILVLAAVGAASAGLAVSAAHAAPAADVVVVWAPGGKIGPVEAAARARGAAVIDRSPAPPAAIETAAILQRGIDAYDAVKYPEAGATLDQARDLVDRTGAAGLTTAQLSDLFLYRGMVKVQLGDDTGAWDELVAAIVVDPARELNPARFPPKVVELFGRARDTTLHDRPAADLELDAPTGCTAFVDGVAAAGKVKLITGAHWVRVACADRVPLGQRIDLTTRGDHLSPQPLPYAPPPEAELLVQARAALDVHALVIAEVHGQIATARKLGLDGRELDRRTVAIPPSGELSPLARAVDELLAPAATTHWYTSRWAWAGAAAAVAAAIAIPITAVIAGGHPATSVSVRPKGLPPL